MILLELFLVFAKIGSISFGGGYAMIPFLQYEVVSRNWLTDNEIMDMLGMSQITPGPIATNMATFVGYNQGGILGAIVATIGVTLPSTIMVILVTRYIIQKLPENKREAIFLGLQPVVVALIFCSCISLARNIFFISDLDINFKIDLVPIIIFIVSLILSIKYKINPIKVIILSAIMGVVFI